MRITDEIVERACAHIGDPRCRDMDRSYVEEHVLLKAIGITHDEAVVAVVEEWTDGND